MILKITNRVTPINEQSRFRVMLNNDRSCGDDLLGCLQEVKGSQWFNQTQALLVSMAADRPRAAILVVEIQAT